MSDIRSPVQILEAILDEVEGFRQCDKRSHLPRALIAEAQAAVGAPAVTRGFTSFNDASEMCGRTVAHTWDSNLIRGEMVIAFTDGGFIVLDVESDGCGEAGYIYVRSSAGLKLSEFVRPRELLQAGLIPQSEYDEIQKAEARKQAERAKRDLERAQLAVKQAEREMQATGGAA